MNTIATESWIALILLLVLQNVLSAGRTSIVNVRKARLKQLEEEGNRLAALVARLAEDSTRFMASTQVAATFIGFSTATVAALTFAAPLARAMQRVSWLAGVSSWLSVALVILVLGLVMLIFGDLVPSLLALQHAERVALALARPMAWLEVLTRPCVKVVVGISNALAGLLGSSSSEAGLPLVTEEEIKTLVDAGEEEGVIEEEEKEMIYSIFEFGDTLVREVMVPRIDILAVDADTPLLEALDLIMEAGHSRVPVYRDTIDNIIGILHVKDTLPYLRRGETNVGLPKLLREAYFVPETKKVDELLPELQQRKSHMAIVVDEYGGTAGLVTIEDLLEEIVGEIQDEYDREEPIYEIVNANEYVLNARMDLDDVAELIGVELPDEGSDTLGGFIYNQLGRVPAEGDVVQHGELRFTVLSVIGRRIHKVRVVREAQESNAPEEASSKPAD